MFCRPTATVCRAEAKNGEPNIRNQTRNAWNNEWVRERETKQGKKIKRSHTPSISDPKKNSQKQIKTPKQKGIAESAIFIIVIDVTPFFSSKYRYSFIYKRTHIRIVQTSMHCRCTYHRLAFCWTCIFHFKISTSCFAFTMYNTFASFVLSQKLLNSIFNTKCAD